MDYRRIYSSLIKRGQDRAVPAGYVEKHHIIPRSHGGDDTPENLVILTAREHFIAHWLLWRIHRDAPMATAFNFMRVSPHGNGKRYYSSHGFAEAARAQAKAARLRMLGVKMSDETRAKMSASHKGKPQKKKGPMSAEHKAKISAANKGISHMKGRKLPASHRAAISAGLKNSGRDYSGYNFPGNNKAATCPHCGKAGQYNAMKRWHFDNCKHKGA